MGDEVPNDQSLKAFDFASEFVKQQLGLATAIIAFSVTLSTDVLTAETGSVPYPCLLVAVWATYLLSIPLGLMTLSALTSVLDGKKQPSIYDNSVVWTAGLQAFAFVFATLLLAIFGSMALYKSQMTHADPNNTEAMMTAPSRGAGEDGNAYPHCDLDL